MKRYETKKAREQRIKRQKMSNAIAMVSAIAVVLVLSVVIWSGKQALAEKNDAYTSKKEELSQAIVEQESRSESIEEYKKYVQTKKYIEEIAKQKFGLIYPDEIVFKPTTSK